MTDYLTAQPSGWAPPDLRLPLPPLSPPFLSADDAARYAHELIGDRRDAKYGGGIIKNGKGQYFATHPIKGEDGELFHGLFLSTDSQGRLKHPEGYTCCAFYHSHEANYEENFKHYRGTPEALQTRINFFYSHNIYVMLALSSFVSVRYLSGLNGSLIKYQGSGSEREKKLFKKLELAAHTREEPFVQVIDAVRALASAGELSVIQATEVWHWKTGQIDPDFSLFDAKRAQYVPAVMIQRPAFGPLLFSEQDALDDCLSRIRQTSESNYGFILKQAQRDEFLVTEPVAGRMDFLLHEAFSNTDRNDLVLPDGFAIMAAYGCESEYHRPDQIPDTQSLVFKNFIHPESLANAINVTLQLGFRTGHQSIPLYIATRDGALLKYVSNLSTDEKKLFAMLPPNEGGVRELTRNVLADVEPTISYVQRVANAGELSVVRASEQWSRVGRVQSDWQPYTGFTPRLFSPQFTDADHAARHAHELIAKRVDAVYGGLIYHLPGDRFIATLPLAVNTETFDSDRVIPAELKGLAPADSTVVGVYYTRRVQPLQLWRSSTQESLSRNMFAPQELYAAIEERNGVKAYYFSAQDGALLKYTVTRSKQEHLLSDQLAPEYDPSGQFKASVIGRRLRANLLKPDSFIGMVAHAGKLDLIASSPLWGARGPVGPEWKPYRRSSAAGETSVYPVLSPLFSSEQEAMRYAHENMGDRQVHQRGLILESLKRKAYVATEPVNAKAYTLPSDFPFSGGIRAYKIPEDFFVCAKYVAAPRVPVDEVSDPVYANFIAPADLEEELRYIHSLHAQHRPRHQYPMLYLSTRDGALLRYLTSEVSQDLERQLFRDHGQKVIEALQSKHMSAQGYVKRVAYIGQLEVLFTSPQWASVGVVTNDWVLSSSAALSGEEALSSNEVPPTGNDAPPANGPSTVPRLKPDRDEL